MGDSTKQRAQKRARISLFSQRSDLFFLALTLEQIWAIYPRKAYNADGLFAFSPHVGYVISNGMEGLAALAIAIAILLAKWPRERRLRVITQPWFGLMGFVSLLAATGIGSSSMVASAAMVTLSGIAKAWCCVICIQMYSRMETKRAISYIFVSYAIAAVLRLPLELLPVTYLCVIVAPLHVLCALICREGNRLLDRNGADALPSSDDRGSASVASYVVIIAVFSLAIASYWMSVETRIQGGMAVMTVLVQAAVPIALMALFMRSYQTIDLGFICQLILMLIMVAVLFVVHSGTGPDIVISTAAYLARYLLKMLSVVVLVALAARSALHPVALFGIGYGALYISQAVGISISQMPWFTALPASISALYLLFLLILAMAVVTSINMLTKRDDNLFPPTPQTQEMLPQVNLIETACERIADERALTNREREVMRLICLGHSKGYIAEHLSLSENTVRSYAKTLYSKLDIHSRGELLELIGLI